MKIFGMLLLLVGAAYLPDVYAQDAAKPDIGSTRDVTRPDIGSTRDVTRPDIGPTRDVTKPNIGLTLTETLNRISPGASTRDDLREIPPPRNDKLKDTVRVTVILGSPECLPGEDGWIAQRPFRRPARSR